MEAFLLEFRLGFVSGHGGAFLLSSLNATGNK